MNERIRELAKKAGGNPNYKAFRGHFLPPPPDYIDPATVDLEKFAELIVRECININKEELAFNAFERLFNRYQEHFGVEE